MSGEHNPGAQIIDDSPLVPNSLVGQTAIVTGGSRGIGFAISKGLASRLKSFYNWTKSNKRK